MDRLVSLPTSYTFFLLLVFLTIVGLFGNIMVIIAISGDRKMRKTAMNMLLLNLAIADALNLITLSVEWSQVIVFGRNIWVLPEFLCPTVRYLECVFLFASIITQLIVCVERYIAIVYPMHARRLCAVRNMLLAVMMMWVFVLLLALPNAICNRSELTKDREAMACQNRSMNTVYWYIYKWVEFLSCYLIPCVIIVALYFRISRVLWAKNKHLQEGNSSTSELQPHSDAIKMRRNVVKMLVACVSVYFICYSPIQFIFLSTTVFKYRINFSLPFRMCMNALALTCSACNPLLYTLFSKKFRTRIFGLLSCKREEQTRAHTETTFSSSRVGLSHSSEKERILNGDELSKNRRSLLHVPKC